MKSLITLLSICFPLILSAQFRQTTWAMDKNKIKEVETAEFVSESDHSLQYNTEVGDWEAILTYYFDNGTYYQADYLLKIKHKNKNDYLEDYFNIKEILSSTYGEPKLENDYEWIDEKHKDNRFFYGHAVSLGHLKLSNTIDNRNMLVKPELSGGDGNIRFRISYVNPYFKKKKTKTGF